MNELEELLIEIKVIYDEIDVSSKENLLICLSGVKDIILARNNLYEMKIAFAKEWARTINNYRCEFVENTDDVTSQYIILHNNYPPISRINRKIVYFEYSEVFTGALQISLFDFISGTTEDLAWLSLYNKRLRLLDKQNV